MNSDAILKGINLLLASIDLVERLGINYREVLAARDRAKAEGRDELSEGERQVFIDEAQDAINEL